MIGDPEYKNNIDIVRKNKGLSINKLSKLTGLSRSTIREAEKVGSNPTCITLIKLAIALNCDIDSLISIG